MKIGKRDLAIRLRQEGKSIREIEAIVECARSSISRWVKHVELTPDQVASLRERNPIYDAQHLGAIANAKKYEGMRKVYRQEGAKKALDFEPLHVASCMLYWGEGTKSSNRVRFSNNNTVMLRMFLKFIKTYFGLGNDSILIRIKCYTDIKKLDEIEEYWLGELGLDRSSLRKGVVNYYSSYSKKKLRGKSPFGTCTIEVKKSMRIAQYIYGALDQYAKALTGDSEAGVT